ncbi:hypothetical protein [Prosthecomicrobium sp. N25]|uniref:hypothetical protein n=1 Tax=Prosthecomicrobium sp. N25 TaxID=3129254 RepID=UPI00307768D6
MYAIHIGAPKTGTTSLQHTLKSLDEELAKHGVRYHFTPRFQKSEIGQFIRGKAEPADSAFTPLRQEIESTRCVLLSDEGCTGPLMNPSKKTWDAAPERAFRFTDKLGIPPHKVIVTVRRQDEFLLSCYLHRLRHGRVTSEFRPYWEQEVRLELMRWSTLLSTVERHYGRDKLVVLPFEYLRADFPGFVRTFLKLGTGTDLTADVIPVESRNQGLGAEQVGKALELVRALKDENKSVREIKETIRTELMQDEPPQRSRPDLGELKAKLAALFRKDNEAVSERYFAVKHPAFLFDA